MCSKENIKNIIHKDGLPYNTTFAYSTCTAGRYMYVTVLGIDLDN